MSDEAVAVKEKVTQRDFVRIVVETVDATTGRTRKKAFDGSWLVGHGSNCEEHQSHNSRGRFSVALSRSGTIVVLTEHDHGYIGDISTFDSFSELENFEGFPPSLLSAIAEELGVEYVEEMHI